jgi:hypothetical protein
MSSVSMTKHIDTVSPWKPLKFNYYILTIYQNLHFEGKQFLQQQKNLPNTDATAGVGKHGQGSCSYQTNKLYAFMQLTFMVSRNIFNLNFYILYHVYNLPKPVAV